MQYQKDYPPSDSADEAIAQASHLTHFHLPELPFFPSAVYERHGDAIGLWWFEADFSQSTYGRHSSGQSRACTLITILNAAGIHRENIQCKPRSDKLPHSLIKVFAESILLGNRIYAELEATKQLVNENLNVPEAMDATRLYSGCFEEWKSCVYMEDLGESLFHCLTDGLSAWWTENQNSSAQRSHLFVVLITEYRSLLFAFQQHPSMISVFDSHQHTATTGSCIAQAPMEHIYSLCQWIRSLFHDIYQVRPNCFELSYIHAKDVQ